MRTVFQQEGQSFLDALLAVIGAQIVALVRNAKPRQPKSSSRDAGDATERKPRGWRAITHHPGARAGLVIEKIAGPPLQIVHQSLSGRGDLGERAIDENAGRVRVRLRRLGFGLRFLPRLYLRRLRLVLRKDRGSQSQRARGSRSPQQLSSGYRRWSQRGWVLLSEIQTNEGPSGRRRRCQSCSCHRQASILFTMYRRQTGQKQCLKRGFGLSAVN